MDGCAIGIHSNFRYDFCLISQSETPEILTFQPKFSSYTRIKLFGYLILEIRYEIASLHVHNRHIDWPPFFVITPSTKCSNSAYKLYSHHQSTTQKCELFLSNFIHLTSLNHSPFILESHNGSNCRKNAYF